MLELLRREQGTMLADLVAATGWLPHTTRAALTGLRKKGHAVERDRRQGVSHYLNHPGFAGGYSPCAGIDDEGDIDEARPGAT